MKLIELSLTNVSARHPLLLEQLRCRLGDRPIKFVFLATEHPRIPDIKILDKLLDGRSALLTQDRVLHNLAIRRGFRSFVHTPESDLTDRRLAHVSAPDKCLPVSSGPLRDSYHKEHHRIGVADRGEEKAVGAFRRGRNDDAQAGDMGEHGLGCFRVMLGGTNAGAMRRAQNHRTAEPPLRSVAEPGCVVHQLIDAGIEESHELDLADGLKPLRRHTDAKPADQSFR